MKNSKKFILIKSLTRALINEETALRKKDSEILLRTAKENLQALEDLLRNLIVASVQEAKSNLTTIIDGLSKKISGVRVFTLQEIAKNEKVKFQKHFLD